MVVFQFLSNENGTGPMRAGRRSRGQKWYPTHFLVSSFLSWGFNRCDVRAKKTLECLFPQTLPPQLPPASSSVGASLFKGEAVIWWNVADCWVLHRGFGSVIVQWLGPNTVSKHWYLTAAVISYRKDPFMCFLRVFSDRAPHQSAVCTLLFSRRIVRAL